jgi:hypothetical protein
MMIISTSNYSRLESILKYMYNHLKEKFSITSDINSITSHNQLTSTSNYSRLESILKYNQLKEKFSITSDINSITSRKT